MQSFLLTIAFLGYPRYLFWGRCRWISLPRSSKALRKHITPARPLLVFHFRTWSLTGSAKPDWLVCNFRGEVGGTRGEAPENPSRHSCTLWL